jgi:effector-binding domain-containing protein
MNRTDQIPIGFFSVLTQLTQKALRLYDEKGILVPEIKDPVTGYRYYRIKQIERGVKIKMMTTMGFGLVDITTVLNAAEHGDKLLIKEMFSKQLSNVQLEINRLKAIEDILIDNAKSLEMLYMNTTQPAIKDIPSLRVISSRKTGKYGPVISNLITELMKQIYLPDNQRMMVKITGPIMFLAHDEGFKEDDADIEVAIPVTGRITVTSDAYEVKNLNGGRVVSVMFTGPYAGIGEAYTRAMEYTYKNGYTIRDSTREIYLNAPGTTPEDQLLTEIQIPIEKFEIK